MARKRTGDTALQWVPTADQSRVLDCLAMGLSQNAASRDTGIPYQTINSWINDLAFSDAFREEVERRSALFQENLRAIEDQQIVQATAVVGRAISGELERELGARGGQNPLQYDAAVELLRNTRWKQKAGEQHKQFGAT